MPSNTIESATTFIGAFSDGQTNIFNATAIGFRAKVTQSNSLVLGSINGVNGAVTDTNVGVGTTAPADRLHVNGIIRVNMLGGAGSTGVCRNESGQLSTCSSSVRYKDKIAPFTLGLDVINRLRPITFNWKLSGARDLGLAAEDVAQVEPLLITYNLGQVEGVKYDRLTVVLVNAILEQQAHLKFLQAQIDSLKKIVCLDHPGTDICRQAR